MLTFSALYSGVWFNSHPGGPAPTLETPDVDCDLAEKTGRGSQNAHFETISHSWTHCRTLILVTPYLLYPFQFKISH